jgi:hypothetical protein
MHGYKSMMDPRRYSNENSAIIKKIRFYQRKLGELRGHTNLSKSRIPNETASPKIQIVNQVQTGGHDQQTPKLQSSGCIAHQHFQRRLNNNVTQNLKDLQHTFTQDE